MSTRFFPFLLLSVLLACDGDSPAEPSASSRAASAEEGDTGDTGGPSLGACMPTVETCDGIDNDCDGVADEGLPDVLFALDCDGDGTAGVIDDQYPIGYAQIDDGTIAYTCVGVALPDPAYPSCEWVNSLGDCDDRAPTVNSGFTEVCDELDNNCNGETDEGC